jgi:hypothetical protein
MLSVFSVILVFSLFSVLGVFSLLQAQKPRGPVGNCVRLVNEDSEF